MGVARCPTTGWTSCPRSITRRNDSREVEYADVAAIGQEALKETAFLTSLRNVDALIHVLRAFEDDAIAHVGPIDPLRDIEERGIRPDGQRPDPGGEAAGAVEKDLKKVADSASWRRSMRCCCGPRSRWRRRCRCASWR